MPLLLALQQLSPASGAAADASGAAVSDARGLQAELREAQQHGKERGKALQSGHKPLQHISRASR